MRMLQLYEDDVISRALALAANQTAVAVWRGDVYLASSMTGLYRIRRLGEPEVTLEVLDTTPVNFVLVVNDRLFAGNYYPRSVVYEVIP